MQYAKVTPNGQKILDICTRWVYYITKLRNTKRIKKFKGDNKMNYYSYQELKAAVVAHPTTENINELGEWFNRYGNDYWNGEYYDADEFRVYPVYEEVEEDEWELKGYEVR